MEIYLQPLIYDRLVDSILNLKVTELQGRDEAVRLALAEVGIWSGRVYDDLIATGELPPQEIHFLDNHQSMPAG